MRYFGNVNIGHKFEYHLKICLKNFSSIILYNIMSAFKKYFVIYVFNGMNNLQREMTMFTKIPK